MGGAAGAEQQYLAGPEIDAVTLGYVVHEAGAIGVVAMPAGRVTDHGVDRAAALGARRESDA